MSEITLIYRLQQLMRIHGNLSVSDLSRLTHIPQPTLHHILSGATKNPRKQALDALAAFFSISIRQLLGHDPLPNSIPEIIKEDLKLNSVPIIQWDMLKNWPLNNARDLHFKEVLLEYSLGEHSFALLVQDSSLEPLFSQNNLLIFDRGRIPKDRDFVIVHLLKEDVVLCNRLFVDNDEKYLRQNMDDGNVKLIKLNEESDRMIGTLTEARVQY